MSSPNGTDRFTGKNGYVTVAPIGGGVATRLDVLGWSWSPEVDEHDVTDTGSGGDGVYLMGIRRGTASIQLKFNAAANPLDGPPAITVGSIVAAVLYMDSAAGAPVVSGKMWVKSTPINSKVGDTTSIDINGRFTGTMTTTPTGNFTPSA